MPFHASLRLFLISSEENVSETEKREKINPLQTNFFLLHIWKYSVPYIFPRLVWDVFTWEKYRELDIYPNNWEKILFVNVFHLFFAQFLCKTLVKNFFCINLFIFIKLMQYTSHLWKNIYILSNFQNWWFWQWICTLILELVWTASKKCPKSVKKC